jgi:dTDP-4-dehydrorhamnose reductase
MKILITGANGFIGHYLCELLLAKGHEVIATGKGGCRLPFEGRAGFTYAKMDFTDHYAVHDSFEKFKPEIVVHGGAISKPDDSELNQWNAYVVNVEGTLSLLANASELKSHFIFISTDFVFSGEGGPYSEEDERAPVNYYGKTKMEAEDAVGEYEFDWAIVRTVLVYGKPQTGKANLLSVVQEKLSKGEPYHVVDDQTRTPTYVTDLAAGIVSIIEKRAKGIYHLSGPDILTPYQMALQAASHLGFDQSLIRRVTAADFSQPAKRPPSTRFNIDKARRELNYHPISFAEGLKKTFD